MDRLHPTVLQWKQRERSREQLEKQKRVLPKEENQSGSKTQSSKTDGEVLEQLRLERKRRTAWAKRTPPVGETAEERKQKFAVGKERSRIKREIEVQKWKEVIEMKRKLKDFAQMSEKQEDQSEKEHEEPQNRE